MELLAAHQNFWSVLNLFFTYNCIFQFWKMKFKWFYPLKYIQQWGPGMNQSFENFSNAVWRSPLPPFFIALHRLVRMETVLTWLFGLSNQIYCPSLLQSPWYLSGQDFKPCRGYCKMVLLLPVLERDLCGVTCFTHASVLLLLGPPFPSVWIGGKKWLLYNRWLIFFLHSVYSS